MGLDINLLARPQDGHEAEFAHIWSAFEADKSGAALPDGPFVTAEKPGLLGFGKSKKTFDGAGATTRFQDISDPAYKTINAPRVGQSQSADDWVRQLFADGRVKAADENAALAQLDGYYVLQLMEPCDGFPIYSHAYEYEGVDRTSFRGAFLTECVEIIGDKTLDRAWESMLAKDFAAWGATLRAAADQYAADHGLTEILGDREFMCDDFDDPRQHLHIVDQCARWVTFWSDLGHGSEPFF